MALATLGFMSCAVACTAAPSTDELAARDDAACRANGLSAETEPYAKCRTAFAGQRQANARSAYRTYMTILASSHW